LCATSFAVLPLLPDVTSAILVFGVLSGVGGHGLGQLTTNQPVVRTIPNGPSRDRAFGVVACGGPVGTAVIPAVGVLAIDNWGWAAGCGIVAGIIALLGTVAAWITEHSHETYEAAASAPRFG